MNLKSTSLGFTLIEVMITVAIIGILAAVAYPSYAEQVARSRRGDAQAALLETAQWLERQYTVSNAYNKTGAGTTINNAALPSLRAKTAEMYTLSFGGVSAASTPTATDYSLRMVPIGSMANDRCGTFVLTNTSAKTVSGGAGVAACWDR
jgi:type IV pilus assembly protein PilE